MSSLIERFEGRQAVVGIIGLGYVGLPLATTFADAGFAVIGFDVDDSKVRELLAGNSYIRHIPPERFRGHVRAETPEAGGPAFHPTSDFAKIANCDAVIICVPTPLTRNREPDLSYVVNTAKTIGKYIRPGQLVVLESTTYPGTTDEVVRPELEIGGLQVGKDFHLAFSPEREDPNNPSFSTKTIPKLVGGCTPLCGEVACALYGAVLDEIVPVSSAQVAEAAKLLENIYRSVNIALVNELKVLFDRMGLNIWEIVAAAATKPFGFTPFHPGPGLGGHCIPIDPFYLTWKARQYDLTTRFIELAGEVNHAMPEYVVSKTADALNEHQRSVNGAKILVLGVSYKRDLDDTRESPALKVMDLLQQKGAEVAYHDPYVPVLRRFRRYEFNIESVPLTEAQLAEFDAVVITTDHSGVDYDMVVRASRLVIDTRNATAAVQVGREKIVMA
ncbi:MAG TPA: nucleotide sugar dehydrogenase [Terriglobales bacterium]|nr:nucleotide sugar dehydrogenase [Terriglobales bacterium]